MKASFVAINSSKTNFDEIYSMADPRDYFSVLGALDYMNPDIATRYVRVAPDQRRVALEL